MTYKVTSIFKDNFIDKLVFSNNPFKSLPLLHK